MTAPRYRPLPPTPQQQTVPPIPDTPPPLLPLENNDSHSESDEPDVPEYAPVLPEKELRIAQSRLEEFINNGKTFSANMGEALPKLIALQASKNFSPSFFTLDQTEQTIWLDFFDKAINYCKIIHDISDPFSQTTAIINQKNLSYTSQNYKQTYLAAIDCLYKEAFDPLHNADFKKRAIYCIWFALYKKPLVEGKLKIQERDPSLDPLLVVPGQRLGRLTLFSDGGNGDCTKMFSSGIINLPEEFKQIAGQFEKLMARSQLIARTVNVMLGQIEKLEKIIEKETFYQFLIEKDPYIQPQIEAIVSIILDDKQEQAEKVIEDYVQTSFAAWLNESFNQILENVVYTSFQTLLAATTSQRSDTIEELKQSFKNAHEDNVTDFKKIEDMLMIAAEKVSLISSHLESGGLFKPKKSHLLTDLEKGAALAQTVYDHLSKMANQQLLKNSI